MEKIYNLPVGTDGIDLALPTGRIGGISIDNPSGSWLRVTGIEVYVPPYTIQWAATVLPRQLTIDVLFRDSPSGAPSELTGGAVTVTLHSNAIPASAGILSGDPHTGGMGQAKTEFQILSPALAMESGSTVVLVPAVAGTSIVPLRIYMSGTVPVSGGLVPLFGGVTLWAGSSYGIPHITVGPFTPFAVADIPPGFRRPVGQSLQVELYSDAGAGDLDVDITTYFYRITES